MPRTEKQKQSQKEYRERNRAKCNAINLASRRRRYGEVGRDYAVNYYFKNRNYKGTDNMGKQLINLFKEL
tara:strand:+ start:4078 stop:4287 length:210 start_codon:yes stop_codon:yes gene_type:complete